MHASFPSLSHRAFKYGVQRAAIPARARCCGTFTLNPSQLGDSGMQQILSAATVTAVGLTCKAYLHSGLCSISVRGLPYLLDALYSSKRRNGQGQGILTGERLVSVPQ